MSYCNHGIIVSDRFGQRCKICGEKNIPSLRSAKPPSASPSAVAQEPGTVTKSVPIDPTPAMIEAGAQRLVRCETGEEVWPDGWDVLQVSAARNEAERVWRSMWLASAPTLTVALSLYESAVKGRWEMRQALRKCREENKALIPASALAKAQQEREALKAEVESVKSERDRYKGIFDQYLSLQTGDVKQLMGAALREQGWRQVAYGQEARAETAERQLAQAKAEIEDLKHDVERLTANLTAEINARPSHILCPYCNPLDDAALAKPPAA